MCGNDALLTVLIECYHVSSEVSLSVLIESYHVSSDVPLTVLIESYYKDCVYECIMRSFQTILLPKVRLLPKCISGCEMWITCKLIYK